MKTLEPINPSPTEEERLEEILRELFRRELYLPLVKALGTDEEILQNAKLDGLALAIAKGEIQYTRGGFEGRFTAQTSKALKGLGAEWDRTQGRWKIPRSELPADIKVAMATSESRFLDVARKIDRALDRISPDAIAEGASVTQAFDRAIFKLEQTFQKSVRKLAIPPKFTPEQQRRMAKRYTENMQLRIKGWAKDEIVRLREQVRANVVKGVRYEALVKTIQDGYGVGQSKAKFLARQETNLLTAEIRQNRFTAMGSPGYIWRCVKGSPNHPVRPYHKRLDGTYHAWNDPPEVDKDGNRKHPGQDYNCRCVAIALAPGQEPKTKK